MKTLLITVLVYSLAAETVKVQLNFLQPPVIQARLERVTRKLPERRAALESLFREAGCLGDALSAQPIPHFKEPNVVCALPAEND